MKDFLPPPLELNEIRDIPPAFIRTENQEYYYREIYDVLIKNGQVVEERDKYGLGMLALNYAQVDELSEQMSEGAFMTVNGDKGNQVTKRNPAIDAMEKVQQQIKFWSKEFRMTPNSRGKTLSGSAGQGNKKHSVLDRIKVNQPGRKIQ